jgi:hypothetical protein
MRHAARFAVHALTTCTVVLAAVAAFAQEVTFAYQFAPGTSERYRIKLNQEADFAGFAMSNLADMEVTVKCVTAVQDKFQMNMTFDKADISTTMAGNTSANPIGEQLVGKTIEFMVAATGEVSDVKPVGEFDAWGQVQQIIAPMVDNWYARLPGKAVAVGGEWKQEAEKDVDASGAETVTKASYKFREIKKDKGRDFAVIDQNTDATIGGTSQTPMGAYTVAGSGTGKMELMFDPGKKRIAKVKGKMDVAMDMTPQSGGETVKAVVTNHIERSLLE